MPGYFILLALAATDILDYLTKDFSERSKFARAAVNLLLAAFLFGCLIQANMRVNVNSLSVITSYSIHYTKLYEEPTLPLCPVRQRFDYPVSLLSAISQKKRPRGAAGKETLQEYFLLA